MPAILDHHLETAEELAELHSQYAFDEDEGLIAQGLGEYPKLFALLQDAVEPLKSAFGRTVRLKLTAIESPEEEVLLCVKVHPARSVVNRSDRMSEFREAWWRYNLHRSEAALCFDYERADGI